MPARALIVALAVSAPLGARAFQNPGSFDTDPSPLVAGGGKVHFTGSPLARGYTCAVCHQGENRGQQLGITTDPPDLAGGTFQPGKLYKVTVALLNEKNGLDHPTDNCGDLFGTSATCNWNGMAAEITDADGYPTGQLCPTPTQDGLCDGDKRALASSDGSQVFGNPSPNGGDVVWTFTWKAPNDQSVVKLFAASVDGDGGGPAKGGTKLRDGTLPDVDGDSVAATSQVAWADNAKPDPQQVVAASSCGVPGAGPFALLFLSLFGLRRRRA